MSLLTTLAALLLFCLAIPLGMAALFVLMWAMDKAMSATGIFRAVDWLTGQMRD